MLKYLKSIALNI